MKTCNDAPVGYTDHPPVGQWQGWNGGGCPVHPLCVVEYVMRAEQAGPDAADQLDWEHSGDSWDIVAYRIVEEYKAPEPQKVAREVWMKQWKMVTFNSSGMFFSGDPKTEHLEWACVAVSATAQPYSGKYSNDPLHHHCPHRSYASRSHPMLRWIVARPSRTLRPAPALPVPRRQLARLRGRLRRSTTPATTEWRMT